MRWQEFMESKSESLRMCAFYWLKLRLAENSDAVHIGAWNRLTKEASTVEKCLAELCSQAIPDEDDGDAAEVKKPAPPVNWVGDFFSSQNFNKTISGCSVV